MASDESSASQNVVADDVVDAPETESAEEQQARLANERFLALLRKQPRPGTALDRVYTFCLDQGTLEQFLSEQRSRMTAGDDEGVACLLVGLIETKQGEHSAAEQAFRLAEQRRPKDATASWMLGRSLLELQKPDAAATVLERAIERTPQKADLLVVYQDLGRAYRRSRQAEKANAVWQRMESQFPDDLRVKEQIASTMFEEGDLEAAIERYEQLASLHRDPYQKTQYAITAADLKLKVGRRDEALSTFEAQLQTLDPESWLARDIRRRIDQLFLQTNDQAGQVSYYEAWLQNHPDDLEVIASLGHALALQGRGLDALNWYRKAIEKAPSKIAMRRELLTLLTREKRFDEAATEYEKLHQLDPGNIQHLEAWGQFVLHRDDQPLMQRRTDAISIWKRMLQNRSEDPGTLVNVAELIRKAELSGEALTLYHRAVELKPQDPQYREYLGDYLQSLGRTDEAIHAWEAIADGDRRNTANLIRLAEIFQAAGMPDKALSAMQASCELTPEFNDRLKLARWLREYELDGRSPRAVDALKQLEIAESLVETDDERRLIQEERIQCLIAARQLDQAIRDLRLKLQQFGEAGDPANTGDQVDKIAADWATLAAYLEAAKNLPDAIEAVKKSNALAPNAVDSWALAARLFEQSGRLADAVDSYQKLMSLNQRARSEYLQKIASLQQRLGRRAETLQAGRELLATGPDNPEFVKFYADLCFHFGDRQEALKTLRRSVRSSSADIPLILELARTLANQNKLDEATALCWTAFEKSSGLEEKSNTVMMLAELALRTNRLDQLIEKLEQHGRVSGQEKDSAQCLATAFRVAGDLRSARRALETLLAGDGRDSQLLLQLSRLAEEDGDLEAAADYQRRANAVVSTEEGETRLASLLMRLGDLSEAEALWNQIAGETTRPEEAIQAIDQLMSLESIDSARQICDRLLAQSPDNWEVMIRQGLMEWRYGEREKADQIFQKVLDLRLESNTPSAKLSASLKQGATAGHKQTQRLPALARLEMVADLAESFREVSPSSWFGPKVEPTTPHDYGAARIIALMGRYLMARQGRSESAFFEQLSKDAAGGQLQAACDQLALEIFISDRSTDKPFAATDFQRFMPSAEAGNVEAQAIYLELIARQIHVWETDDGIESTIDNPGTRFLSAEQFSLLITCFENVLNHEPEWLETFDAPRLLGICQHQQQLAKLDDLIASLLQRENVGPQFSMGIDLGLLRQTLTVKSALEAMTRLKRSPGTVNSAGDVALDSDRHADFESFFPRLLKIARIKQSSGEQDPGLQVLDWWLQWRRESWGEFELRTDPGIEHQAAREMIEGVLFRNSRSQPGFNSAALHRDSDVAATLGVKNLFTSEECEFLTHVFVLFLQEKSSQQLTDWFKAKAAPYEKARRPDVEFMQVVFWNIQGHRELVLLHLIRAIELSPNDNLLKLVVALRLEELNMNAEAIELIDRLPDSDPLLFKCREFKSLDLARTLQLSDIGRVSLTRLTGMDLNESERDYVFRELGRFGLEDLRSDLDSRRTKVKAETADASPLALLDHYEQQGNLPAAVQVAQQLLRRSHKNPTPWRNTTRPTPEQIYARAYKVLKETGELDKMIERQKAQLAKSPQSGRLQKTLLDYLKAAGRVAEADELRTSWQRNQPGLSAEVMINQAEELIAAKQPEKACDQFLEVLHQYPTEFWREVEDQQIILAFTETNRLRDLGNAVLLADRGRSQSFAPTQSLEGLIRALLKDSRNHATAAALIQRYSEMYPAYTVSVLQVVEELPLWSSPDLFAQLRRMYVPSRQEQLRKPQLAWPLDYEFRSVRLGFDQLAIRGGGNLKRLCDALKFSEERRREMELTTKEAMLALPDWPAGHVILIVCALSEPEKSLNQDHIESLVNEMCDDSKPPIPEAVAYNLTQLLRQRGESMKLLAVKLLTSSLQKVPKNDLDAGMPASRTLLELSFELNQSSEGLKFLQSSVLNSPSLELHDQEIDLREIGSRLTAGKFFLMFGRPVAALRVLQGLTVEDESLFLDTAADHGWPTGPGSRAGRSGLLDELRNSVINAITVEQIAQELRLVADMELTDDVTSLDLQTVASGPTEQTDCRPVCSLMEKVVAKADLEANSIRRLADELTTALKTPNPDVSLIALGTAIVFRSNDEEAVKKLVPSLSEYFDRESLTQIEPNETSENYHRRQNAVLSFSVVATYATATEATTPLLIRFYEQSLMIARRDGDRAMAIAILNQVEKFHRAGGNVLAADVALKEMQNEQAAIAVKASAGNPKSQKDPVPRVEEIRALLRNGLLKPAASNTPPSVAP